MVFPPNHLRRQEVLVGTSLVDVGRAVPGIRGQPAPDRRLHRPADSAPLFGVFHDIKRPTDPRAGAEPRGRHRLGRPRSASAARSTTTASAATATPSTPATTPSRHGMHGATLTV